MKPDIALLTATILVIQTVYDFGQSALPATIKSSIRREAEDTRPHSQLGGPPANFKATKLNAKQGDARAQYLLGRMYENGSGVSESSARAAKWYRKAAEQDFAPAQYSLGRLYSTGEGVRQDYAEAMQWFLKAAAQDYALAKNRLGVMYERGQGVLTDYVHAYKWYTLAALENQNVFAVANREVLARRMTAGQIAEAERCAGMDLSQTSTALDRK